MTGLDGHWKTNAGSFSSPQPQNIPALPPMKSLVFFLCILFHFVWGTAASAISVLEVGVVADGKTDGTQALQAAMDSGKKNLFFPPGTYVFGNLTVPGDALIVFDPQARVVPNSSGINYSEEIEKNGKTRTVIHKKPLFSIAGDRVRLEGLRYDFSAGATERDLAPVTILVAAKGVQDVVVSRFSLERSSDKPLPKNTRIVVLETTDCKNVVMENSGVTGVTLMLNAVQCSNVTVRGNWMIGGGAMTTFAQGSESLRHYDNWSRGVAYQCVWRGGSPDPSRKAPVVPLGTANVVHRDVRLEDAKFTPHTRGVYDVLVQNNYAEYGTVLCWGNKGRQVIVDGNIARFMLDYSFGSEGDENVIYSNNISVNSCVAGIVSLYWGEKLLITGNLIIVRHEKPFLKEWVKGDRPEGFYMGQFIRLHHGIPNVEDKYGSGSISITGNLFVNELADRPSGISIEAGRDVLFNGNKVINGLLRKSDELVRTKTREVGKDADEFSSQQAAAPPSQEETTVLRRVGGDLSRLTVMDNEFISRQAGEKPMVLVNGSVASAIIKNNVFRREESHLKFTDAQRTTEKDAPRYMLYSEDNFDDRDLTNAKPASAIGIAPFTSATSVVQGNFIYGWKNAISADNPVLQGKSLLVVTDNTTDGTISVTGDPERTVKRVEGNIEVPSGMIP